MLSENPAAPPATLLFKASRRVLEFADGLTHRNWYTRSFSDGGF